jgi:hypothetical protein
MNTIFSKYVVMNRENAPSYQKREHARPTGAGSGTKSELPPSLSTSKMSSSIMESSMVMEGVNADSKKPNGSC